MYETMDAGKIGKRIKDLRLQRELTSEELAKALGISASAINMYECGQRVPRDEIKITMAEFFGCTIEDLFYPTK